MKWYCAACTYINEDVNYCSNCGNHIGYSGLSAQDGIFECQKCIQSAYSVFYAVELLRRYVENKKVTEPEILHEIITTLEEVIHD